MIRMPNPHQSQIDNYNRELLIQQQQASLMQRQKKLSELHHYRNRIVKRDDDETPEITESEMESSSELTDIETETEIETDPESDYPIGNDESDEEIEIDVKIPNLDKLKKLASLQKDTLPETPSPEEKVEIEHLLNPPKKLKNPPKEQKSKEYIICNVCGKQYTKTNSTSHKKTQFHQLLDRINKNILRNVLLVDPNHPNKNFVKDFV